RDRSLLGSLRTEKPDGHRFAAGVLTLHMTPYARNTEVVSHHRDSDLAHAADDGLNAFELFSLARTIEENVMPMGRVEVLDGGKFESLRVHGRLKLAQLVLRPEFALVGADAPAAIPI